MTKIRQEMKKVTFSLDPYTDSVNNRLDPSPWLVNLFFHCQYCLLNFSTLKFSFVVDQLLLLLVMMLVLLLLLSPSAAHNILPVPELSTRQKQQSKSIFFQDIFRGDEKKYEYVLNFTLLLKLIYIE